MVDCGKDFFLDGKFLEGLEEVYFKKFICQIYKNDWVYFVIMFDIIRKIVDFLVYKLNIGNLVRVFWINLYEYGMYISYI